jgi:BolA protein
MRDLQPEAAAGPRAARMQAVLTEAFQPARLDIEDESARHAGHAGAHPAGETHFRIGIVSELFTSRSRVERSRMVHAALASEFAAGLHALSLILHAPSESKS